mgnify:CR=1 FL=1
MSKDTILEFRLRLNKDVESYHIKGYENTFLLVLKA